jgi:hypothetical protein
VTGINSNFLAPFTGKPEGTISCYVLVNRTGVKPRRMRLPRRLAAARALIALKTNNIR